MTEPPRPVIQVDSLTVDAWQHWAWARIINQVSLSIARGETLGLVGESGCGKTTTAYALLGYHRPGSRFRGGRVHFEGRDLLTLEERELQAIRGGRIAIVPQNPATALNPSMSVGLQVTETVRAHGGAAMRRYQIEERCMELLAAVGLPEPRVIARRYPHQLSGGQQQRVAIAMALSCRPALLVLDEPTTGLDVTTQARILGLLSRLQVEHEMAMFYVSHNMAVLAQVCHRLAVMYAGELVEIAQTGELFRAPRHPYTRALIASVFQVSGAAYETPLLRSLLTREELPPGCKFAPRCEYAQRECFAAPQVLAAVGGQHHVACQRWRQIADGLHVRGEHGEGTRSRAGAGPGVAVASHSPRVRPRAPAAPHPVLLVEGLRCAYSAPRSMLQFTRRATEVVHGVSFSVAEGETFALVGETGSGKSTIARAIAGLLPPRRGRVIFDNQDITVPVDRRSKEVRRQIQIIFQNPDASLNPRQRVAQIVGRPLTFFFGRAGGAQQRSIAQLLETAQLPVRYMHRLPRELSGGERQRVAIARALAAEPRVLLCDEILSALDVPVQASIVTLLRTLQAQRQLACLFISHDLAVVRSLAHRVGVLYKGQLCEVGDVEEVFLPPYHPYTEVLLRAIPNVRPSTNGRSAPASPGPEVERPTGASACPFAPRCPRKLGAICDDASPPWRAVTVTHAIRCHIPLDDLAGTQRVVLPGSDPR